MLTGSTRLAAVIGSPIRHSRSPELLNAAFAAAGLDWAYVAFEVAPGDGPAAVAAMRALGLGGLSVTMPHKADVAAAVDRLTPEAERLGAVNCVFWDHGDLVGDSTDGPGFLDGLAAAAPGWDDLTGRRCVVLGAGGAARAVIAALAHAGAAEVVVVNRTAERAEAAVELTGGVGRVGSVDDVADADLLVNATSIGMGVGAEAAGPSDLPIAADLLRPGLTVADLVYMPLRTPLLAAAEACGATTVTGLPMLVHQAAHAFRRWTGVDAPVAAMTAAASA